MSNLQVMAKKFGLEGKALALVDFEQMYCALAYVEQNATPEIFNTLKAKYQFSIIPVQTNLYGLKGKKAAVVDYEKAQGAIEYIKTHVEPQILESLKTNYEFDFYPIQTKRKRTLCQMMLYVGVHVLKWSLVALLLVKCFG